MSQFMQRQPARRAPRASVRGTISAVIQMESGHQRSAKLQQLSITGGLLDIANYVEERSWVDLTIYLDSCLVRGTAEMMFPMRGGVGYLQPFRFIRLGSEELHAIDREVMGRLTQAATPKHGEPTLRPQRYHFESWWT